MSVYTETRMETIKSRMETLAYKPRLKPHEAEELKGLMKSLDVEIAIRDAPVPVSERNYLKFRANVATGELPNIIEERLPKTMQELYTKVACHLTGRDVTVRLQKPYLKDIHGVHMPVAGGGSVIDISPDMSQAQEYWYFLHELAHARLHYTPLKYHNTALDFAPSTVELLPEETAKNPVVSRKENEAEMQAENWDSWAEHMAKWESFGWDSASKSLHTRTEIVKLFTLLGMEVYTE